MAKGKLKLKWQSEIADCHAGPFIVTQHAWDFGVILEVNGRREELGLNWRFKTQADAKRACERLVARILGAMTHANR